MAHMNKLSFWIVLVLGLVPVAAAAASGALGDPLSEPTKMLLVGCGLIGLSRLGRERFGNRSRG
jgi:hypothetical protein